MDKGYLEKATDSRHWERRQNQPDSYFFVLEKQIGNLTGKRLLDVGCATGVDVNYFAMRGLLAEGVDISEKFICEARKKYPNSKFTVGDAEDLPFEDSTFDVVFSINTLFYTNLEKSLREFIRVTKSGGYCIFGFDVKITDLDKNTQIHFTDIEDLKHIVSSSHSNLIYMGDIETRIDLEPFKHRHEYRKIIVHKP